MSRGPGSFQCRILDTLGREPLDRMWWPKIKQRFPNEVADKRFYRAVRGLRRMGRVEFYINGGLLYLVRKPYYRKGQKIAVADEQLRELLALSTRTSQAQQRDLAAQAKEWEELAAEFYEVFEGNRYTESTPQVGTYRQKRKKLA